jgi:hypothetical protein
MNKPILMTALVLVGPLVFWACTLTPDATADQIEDLLVAADFKYPTADTPQLKGHLSALPRGQFIRHRAGGEVDYRYADVAGCKCVWRGDAAAFSRFRELARERKVEYKDALYESQDEELFRHIGW